MIRILFLLLFIVSGALSASGIILASRLRSRYNTEVFSPLIYFQVFIYTFGFYGIWGQVVINEFLKSAVSPSILEQLLDVALLMGLPFLIFAWFMLIKFTGGLAGKAINKGVLIFVFLLVNALVILILVLIIAGKEPTGAGHLISNYYITMNLVHYLMAAYLIHFPWKGQQIIHDQDRKIIAPILFIIMIFQCMPILFMESRIWLQMIFILGFFTGNIFLPVYFNYFTLAHTFASTSPKTGQGSCFEEFCKKYDVTPRESDVIKEICNGLSNKEISEKLFISLQTVKDHTHHIYIKTNVKSRVQLINLLKDEMAPFSGKGI
jgi:DNA-binding CsgD family transcriptional regulator